MSIGRQNGTVYFSHPLQISARAGLEINRSPGRFNPERRSDSLQRLIALRPHGSCSLYGFAIQPAIGLPLDDYPIFDGSRGPCVSLRTGPALERDSQRKIDAKEFICRQPTGATARSPTNLARRSSRWYAPRTTRTSRIDGL